MSTTATASATAEAARTYLADLYDAFQTGDATAWAERLSEHHEPVVIGTDPEEFWDDRAHLVETVHAQAAAMAASGTRLVAGAPAISVAGPVAWIADQPTMVLSDGRRIPMRCTVVLVDEGDGLRMAQGHLSVGHPNEDMLDLALPV